MTKPADLPPRIADRPDPSLWADDELLTLREAVALFWPRGPLTVASLRTAHRNKQLDLVMIARKALVTPGALRAMARGVRAPHDGGTKK